MSFCPFGSEVFVQIYTFYGRTWNHIRPLPEICDDHLSDESLSFIKSCLQECIKNHKYCRQSEGSLPTRLLDVGHRDDGVVRLIETETITSARFIALSYCWGSAVTIKTTLAGLGKMKLGLEVSELPQAYIDAVHLTRRLGIRYLWIDALCIIQDCHEDWEKESARMSEIYAKAHLTISAASSASATQAFLRRNTRAESNTDNHSRRVFTERVGDGEDSALVRARVISEFGVHWKWQSSSDKRYPREPLLRRGWTLQEQLLSTRLLSISNIEMQWTCQEAVFCECRSRLNHRREFGHKSIVHITDPGDAFRLWRKVVENYSKRVLTNPKDKLPAISGIAKIVQQKSNSSYAAGLWTNNIDLDLLWRRATRVNELPPTEFIAPSFSWASINGEVDYYCFRNGKQPYRKSSSVVGIETKASLNAPLGRVESGRLTIRGPLISGFIEKATSDGWLVVRLSNIQLELIADTVLQESKVATSDGSLQMTACRWRPHNLAQKSSAGIKETPDQPHANITKNILSPGTQCWALRLGYFVSVLKPESPQYRDHELLILGKRPTNPEAFERLGLVSYYDDGEGQLYKQGYVTTITVL
ncbi:hypothetical protein FOVG_19121 [Fusarium oxysporum f. sp. pisi HDV247]|uniref:Heterokaryon incompatibility domain-containing protein n=1 Tax=Fusarium oxysporum f. sp. pisi HDV247 TaxID=1080344 RepID=W9NF89_FUSOX|nr:hypothetical protein FOVG_19121 [Fusarium oxysporum f. sp. pisi HDV247]